MPLGQVALARDVDRSPAVHRLLDDVIEGRVDPHLLSHHPVQGVDVVAGEDRLRLVRFGVAHVPAEPVPAHPGVEESEVNREGIQDQDAALVILPPLAVVVLHLVPFGEAAVDILQATGVEALPMGLVLGEGDAVIRVAPRAAHHVLPQDASVVVRRLLLGEVFDAISLGAVSGHLGHRMHRAVPIGVVVDVVRFDDGQVAIPLLTQAPDEVFHELWVGVDRRLVLAQRGGHDVGLDRHQELLARLAARIQHRLDVLQETRALDRMIHRLELVLSRLDEDGRVLGIDRVGSPVAHPPPPAAAERLSQSTAAPASISACIRPGASACPMN